MASLMPQGKQQYFDDNGVPLASGFLYTYEAGTDTPLDTFTDYTGGTANTNPVQLNARGEATVFWGSSPYKIVLADKDGVVIWTQDHCTNDVSVDDGASGSLWTTVQGFINKIISSAGSSVIGFLQSGTGAVATTVQSKLRESVSVKDFGAVGDGIMDDGPAFQAAHDACHEGTAIRIPRPSSFYLVNTAISITKGMHWVGDSADSSQHLNGVTLKSTAAIDVFNISPASSDKVFQFENFSIIGGTNGFNYAAAGKYISRHSFMRNIELDSQTNAGIKSIMGMIGCHHSDINCIGTGDYGLWVEGTDGLLNASQWDSCRFGGKSVESLHLKARSGIALFNNCIIESNFGAGLSCIGSSAHFYGGWFENNGMSAGDPDIILDVDGAAVSQVRLFGTQINSPNAAQANVRVKFNSNNCMYSEFGVIHASSADIINANNTNARIGLYDLYNPPVISSPSRLDLVNLLAFSEGRKVAAADLSPTINPNTGVTVSRGNLTRSIVKATVNKSAWTTAGLSQNLTIFTGMTGVRVTGAWIKVTEAFAGTGWATATVWLGILAPGDYLAVTSVLGVTPVIGDADAEVGSLLNRANAVQGGHYNNGNNIQLNLTTTGGNINAITAGTLEVYVETQKLP